MMGMLKGYWSTIETNGQNNTHFSLRKNTEVNGPDHPICLIGGHID